MKCSLGEGLQAFELKNFDIKTMRIESMALKGNPLGDPNLRFNPLLIPRGESPKKGYPVVVVLSGLTSNGSKSFAEKAFEENTVQAIDNALTRGECPEAIFLFVDAMTFWGGSQFINSPASGNYEDYIIEELLPTLKSYFEVSDDASDYCITGASSGGYGALHLASRYPGHFGVCAALAPDSDFSISLLPDLYKAAPVLDRLGVSGVKKEILEGRFFRRREAFPVQLAIAMAACYSSERELSSQHSFPIDLKTGEVKTEAWRHWLSHDPLVFLSGRKENLKKLKKIYIDVGCYDQFHLMFGCRKMKGLLEKYGVDLSYSEFDGGHFDMAPRRLVLWDWLARTWRA